MKNEKFALCNWRLRPDKRQAKIWPFLTTIEVAADFNQMVSLWRPTWRERLSVLLFGKVWLHVMGNPRSHPALTIIATRKYFHADASKEQVKRSVR